MADLMSVDDAVAQILANVAGPQPVSIQTEDALGRLLAEGVVARESLPPFDNSAMDGFALRSEDAAQVPQTLRVVMDIPAGVAPQRALQAGEAARIMTGAPVPPNADAVVPVEQTDAVWEQAASPVETTVTVQQAVKAGQHIRNAGESVEAGTQVLAANTVLRPQDIGLLAGLGVPQVRVWRQPTVAILSTGDELVAIDEPLTPGKIRDANSYSIAGLVAVNGGVARRLPPAGDTIESVRALFQAAIAKQPDIIVSTAGVSVGTYDVVRNVLDELGEIGFWRVNMRPGKPLAFGQVGGIPFFGLPGNPVSAMVTFEVFVRPALRKLAGLPNTREVVTAITGEAVESDGRRTFARVKLQQTERGMVATTTGTQSSGALVSMVLADGLMVIPEGKTEMPAGTEVQVWLLGS